MNKFIEPDKTGVYRYLKKMEASGYLTSVLEYAGDKDGGNSRIHGSFQKL